VTGQQKGYGADPGKVIDLLTYKYGQAIKDLTIAECVIDDLNAQLEMYKKSEAQSSGT
jgi:hypothetical protein